jgi:hypothetical protein
LLETVTPWATRQCRRLGKKSWCPGGGAKLKHAQQNGALRGDFFFHFYWLQLFRPL